MKICMFTNTYLPHVGGVARSVANFTEDLREPGHQVVAPSESISRLIAMGPFISKSNCARENGSAQFRWRRGGIMHWESAEAPRSRLSGRMDLL